MSATLVGQQVVCRAWQAAKPLGEGRLLITEDLLTWRSGDEQVELKYSYPEISVHAISRDLEAFPHECLYILIIVEEEEEEGACSEEDELTPPPHEEGGFNGAQGEGLASVELRIVPNDMAQLGDIYSAISHCQALHPDPDLSSDSQEEMDLEGMDGLEEQVQEDELEEPEQEDQLEEPGQEENHCETDGQGHEGQYDDAV